MTKKHYIILAETIRVAYINADPKGKETLLDYVSDLCSELRRDNSRFKAARFTRACGV